MRQSISALFVLALGCGGSSPPPAPPAPAHQDEEKVEPMMGHGTCGYALYGLEMVSAPEHRENHAAFGIAAAAADQGQAAYDAGDGRAAAHHFLDCARAFREVPDGHFQRATAAENAGSCYKNAYYSFGKANAFKSEGRALFEAARADDPRMASVLDELLGKDPDCE
jgi:hypothetical protein